MNIFNHIRAVVFDVDGTLFDTLPSLAAAANDVLVAAGLHKVPIADLRPALSTGLRPMFRQAIALQGQTLNPGIAASLEDDFMAHYTHHWLTQAPLYTGALDFIAKLRAREVKVGICTNRDRASTETLLQTASLGQCFDALVGLGDVSLPKPAAAPLLRAVELLGLSPAEVLFVGDSAMDARCAEAAGVRFAAHSSGYASQATDLLPQAMSFATYEQLQTWVLDHSSTMQEICHG